MGAFPAFATNSLLLGSITRVCLQDIYFQGGFGTMQWIDAAEYAQQEPDAIVLCHPHETLDLLTSTFGPRLVLAFHSHVEERQQAGAGVAASARHSDAAAKTWEEGGSSAEPAGAAAEGAANCDAAVISIDARGMDVRVRRGWRCSMHRLPFDSRVETPAQAQQAVERALEEHGA